MISGSKRKPRRRPRKAPRRRCACLARNSAPIPVPETAEEVTFDGAGGRLEFNSASSVKALAEFYRSTMKSQAGGTVFVINRAHMVVLDFSKGGKAVSFTIMRLGDNANVTADGSALITAAAGARAIRGRLNPPHASNQRRRGSRGGGERRPAGAETPYHGRAAKPRSVAS